MKTFALILLFIFTVNIFSDENKKNWNVDYKTDLPITAVSLLIGILPSYLVKNSPSYMKEQKLDKNEINSFDSFALENYNTQSAKISDYLIIAMPLTSLSLNYLNNSNSNFYDETIIIAETLAISVALNTIVKFTINRPRPYIYSDRASQEEKNKRDAYLSFYSGHSSFAFATSVSFSVIMSKKYKKTWQKSLIWGISTLLASSVAYLRVNAGKHFPSDVIAGAMAGASIGWLIPYLHEKKNQNLNVNINKNGSYLTYTYNF